MEIIRSLIKNSLMEAAMQPSCTDFETKTELILEQIDRLINTDRRSVGKFIPHYRFEDISIEFSEDDLGHKFEVFIIPDIKD